MSELREYALSLIDDDDILCIEAEAILDKADEVIKKLEQLLRRAKCPEQFSKVTDVSHLQNQGGMWTTPACDFCLKRNEILTTNQKEPK